MSSSSPSRSRLTAVAVPVLVVGAVGCAVESLRLSDEHLHQMSSACRYLDVSGMQFVTAYAGTGMAVLVVLLYARRLASTRTNSRSLAAARRSDAAPRVTRADVLAAVATALAACVLLVSGVAVWAAHGQQAEVTANAGRPLCEGSEPAPGGVLTW
ncbi:hypothetical protein ACTWQF_26935 [Streptomyces sp. 8N114]|uniref:hypothetical protein n=1 Tax=Streptomyces sp. 8N114 TaxID=3457419 RepID=UPI003FCF7676